MKYIRTKDGRIYCCEGDEYWDNNILYSKLYPKELERFKETIINQSDTIEELCDGIVEIHTDILYKSHSYSHWVVGDAMFEDWKNIISKKHWKRVTKSSVPSGLNGV